MAKKAGGDQNTLVVGNHPIKDRDWGNLLLTLSKFMVREKVDSSGLLKEIKLVETIRNSEKKNRFTPITAGCASLIGEVEPIEAINNNNCY